MEHQKAKRPVFREKSIERISSPDRTDDYIRNITPPVLLVPVAALIVLAGALVFFVYGPGI